MELITAIVFWLAVCAVGYAYIGYPLILCVVSWFCRHTVQHGRKSHPGVSLIITVHNEQERIQQKIDNTLTLDYPREKLEIIFASDASTDRTEEIIQSYKMFRLVRSPERNGKEFAQKLAIDKSSGEILIFSDVATTLEPEGLKKIVAGFVDPSVGCVSSEDRFMDESGRVSGEGAYVKYEMFLRRLESRVYSVVGLSGSFFAARREVCVDWAVDLQSDFNTLLNALKLGFRGISDPESLGFYRNISDEKKEFSRKVRTVVRGLRVLQRNLKVLNPFRYGLFSWQLFSHKVCRWLVPFFLFLAFVSNIVLLPVSMGYVYTMILQLILYFMAGLYLLSVLCDKKKSEVGEDFSFFRKRLFKIPYYFLVVNAAILVAWIKFFKGERAVYWNPSKR